MTNAVVPFYVILKKIRCQYLFAQSAVVVADEFE